MDMDIQPSSDGPLTGTAPEGETLVTLHVAQIECFERDPRESPNPEYARIRASILAAGLEQPLVVSQRPGEDKFVIAAGGNTRLRILRELYAETRDARFARAPCVVRAWPGESEVLLAHLRENDLRGDLTYFDKARAVMGLRDLLAAERDGSALSTQEAVDCLRDRGYALSTTTLWYMEFVVNSLASKLPKALAAGLGRRDVERFCALERAARAVWKKTIGEGESFDEVLTALCRRLDGEVWDESSLRDALEAEIADRLNQSIHATRLALEVELTGGGPFVLPRLDEDAFDWPDEPAPQSKGPGAKSRPDTSETAAPISPDSPGPAVHGDSTTSTSLQHPATAEPASTEHLPTLRQDAALRALAFAAYFQIDSLILPTESMGLGYLVADVPPAALLDKLTEADLAATSLAWWQLVACAEMTAAPPERLLPHIASDGVLARALRRQDGDLIFNAVWTLDPGQVGYRLWRVLTDGAWTELLGLMTTYRQLHQVAEVSGIDLWKGGSQ